VQITTAATPNEIFFLSESASSPAPAGSRKNHSDTPRRNKQIAVIGFIVGHPGTTDVNTGKFTAHPMIASALALIAAIDAAYA
jgi:hypothetical protein